MKNKNGTAVRTITKLTLEAAIAQDSYEWLMVNSPRMVDAISNTLGAGADPEQVRWVVSNNVGPDRQGMATRCYQAARWIAGEFDVEA